MLQCGEPFTPGGWRVGTGTVSGARRAILTPFAHNLNFA